MRPPLRVRLLKDWPFFLEYRETNYYRATVHVIPAGAVGKYFKHSNTYTFEAFDSEDRGRCVPFIPAIVLLQLREWWESSWITVAPGVTVEELIRSEEAIDSIMTDTPPAPGKECGEAASERREVEGE